MFTIILKVGLEECKLQVLMIPLLWRIINLLIFFDKSGFGEVMTLVNVYPTILEECQFRMHVDHVENMLCDSYFVEFAYDPTCNYYERVKYGCRNFYVTKLPLFMLRLHMLVFACLDNLFAYKMTMHRKYVRLRCVCHVFYDALLVLQFFSFM